MFVCGVINDLMLGVRQPVEILSDWADEVWELDYSLWVGAFLPSGCRAVTEEW